MTVLFDWIGEGNNYENLVHVVGCEKCKEEERNFCTCSKETK